MKRIDEIINKYLIEDEKMQSLRDKLRKQMEKIENLKKSYLARKKSGGDYKSLKKSYDDALAQHEKDWENYKKKKATKADIDAAKWKMEQ